MKNNTEKIWCIVPAAGIGSRMGSEKPKQYLSFRSSTVIGVTLERLLSCKQIEKIVVCIHPEDEYLSQSSYATENKVLVTTGGKERADSVLNGISYIKKQAGEDDWVLVHDAARPCIRVDDVKRLINIALETQTGAILAAPIHDTVKEQTNSKVIKTLDRSRLWRALTPQIFKLKDLERALIKAKELEGAVTDEASAIEQIDLGVQLIQGSADNIKITLPADIALASFYIEQQKNELCE